ncbi:regulating synaptic membrane exocytosis protein 1 isoform X1 [Drosophila gunungcola]|nr:regulating synaptic membrane exocytosis protein 1 isoform X1 [Drosophila gunungcola]XP_052847163.1 regulating synaptic membrane exocytosis protein 1 isoform X1 [Drosophila gunungcola]XP_052847166.1 regulating synaptic membrane exocytosis protein 1 isoform X1 [Drosophila gunungcola]XP_052847167.1 regulating synaptic membrane exocytosis protein 1 isoform X1 [Drosophila gunungcola]
MLPTNVMSFMKKMVATDEQASERQQHATDSGGGASQTGALNKMKATISSSLLTVTDKVNKMSPRPSLVPTDADTSGSYGSPSYQSQQQMQQHQDSGGTMNNNNNNSSSTATSGGGGGGVAAKQEPGRRAGACRVCLKSFKPDDYHKTCFECQQRVCEDCASYSKLDEHEDATMWRCSVCRRKMASRVCIPQDSTDSMLDVPVLEALQRRHSDAKLGSSTQTLAPSNGAALAPPRSPELRRHSDVSPASLKELERQLKGGRSMAPSRSNSPPRGEGPDGQPPFGAPLSRMQSRRGSRVARQHSYDDDMKTGPVGGSMGGGGPALGLGADGAGLGIPAMPRRKSAYDVFAPGLTQGGATTATQLQRSPGEGGIMPPIQLPGSRRPSFRVPHPSEDIQNDDSPGSPDKGSPVLTVDDDRRMRRRGSQLPDIAMLQNRGALPAVPPSAIPPPMASFTGPNLEDLEAPRRQTSMDGEAIRIVIHDVDSGPICASKRRIILRRDPTDKAHRTRGFGMRVVGGKTGADGRLFAYVVWTVPGGAAEKNGLQQGDKILEWNGMSLIDRSFEEVCSIMDRTGDIVELLVEHATDFRMCDLFDENLPPGNAGGQSGPRRSGDGPVGLGLIAEPETTTDKSPASPTRRKLPKTPEQIAREKLVTGRVQIQVWYHAERNELVVSLMAGDDLALRDEAYGHGNLPEAYAKVRILPKCGDGSVQQTEVSRPTQNPIWNATLTFGHVKADTLMDRYIDIQLWDLVPHTESIFLGECSIELQQAFLDDQAIWCRLEDTKGLRGISISKSPSVSPRGSIAAGAGAPSGDVTRLLRRDYNMQRSNSDDVDSIGDGTSLLHPDHAYIAGSRRGSSQSETMEVEVYQLGKDFSRSLPGSRRSSFQDAEKNRLEEDAMATPPTSYLVGRRRSSVARRDPDEILKSLKAVRGELGRTMSLGTEQHKRIGSRRSSRVGLPSGPNSRKSSVLDLSQQQQQQLQQLQQLQLQQQQQQYLQQHLPMGMANADTSPPSEDEDRRYRPRWKGSGSQLPPQSPKQALSRLKQAASASNVAQDSGRQVVGQLMATNPQVQQQQQRKSSMFQLGDSQTPSPTSTTTTTLQRKGSMYVAKVTETPPLGTPTRKGSVYQRSGVGLGVDNSGGDSPQRKQSVVKTLSGSYVNMPALTGGESSYGLKLGPSQIHPKGYRLTTARYGELKMGFVKIKGNVEVELICARNIVNEDCETPPDTYVKCYIKDGDRLRHKKKTRVVRHAAEPLYRQTIKYQSSDVFGRNIVIMVWQRCVGFEHNQGLGGTEVNLDKVSIGQPINGWYPLFPMHSYGGSDSDNSP